MTLAGGLAALYQRDLTRLMQQLQAFPDAATLWQRPAGISNSAGNLVLHLEGNLREYIGRQLGKVAYNRQRDQEFVPIGLASSQLQERVGHVQELVVGVVSGLSATGLEAVYPENVLGPPMSTHQFLVHLYGHLNYHLGQIDYLRRILTEGAAVEFVGL
jgi:hypothetical protein